MDTVENLEAQLDAAYRRYMFLVCDDYASLKGLMPEAHRLGDEMCRLRGLIAEAESRNQT